MISLILSGGVGSRLWPVSREKLPKQFSPLFGETLFTQTMKRQEQLGEVIVCTGEVMKSLTQSAIRNHQLNVLQSFYEPVGRNTAPAIGLVLKYLQLQGREDEVLGVFPSDHWIEKQDVFFKALKLAEECALQKQIVTIGLKPSHPATGFGYIDCQIESFAEKDKLRAYPVKAFKEKPSLEVAQDYLAKGHYFWNSGMFVFQVSTMIQAFQEHLPDIWSDLDSLQSDFSNIEEVYGKVRSESIDYGVMEKASNQVNIPCDIGWSDLGSWDDVAKAAETTPSVTEHVQLIENQASGCFVYTDQPKTVALSSVENLLIVETQDALLVTQRGQSQSVKQIVESLKKQNENLVQDHVYEYRPWGMYRNLYEEESFKTKVIHVDPGQQLSYQSHKQRAEIWVTVEGQGEVVLNDQVHKVKRGSVIEIPQGAKHRMRNVGSGLLKFVEVQIGDYFGEDDIVRYQDDYKRI